MVQIFKFLNNYIISPALFTLIFISGIYLTAKTNFFVFRKPHRIMSVLTKKQENAKISSFKALTVALAGTLGVGNISGVAAAIVSGGPGSLFWMWVCAALCMVIKYSEIVLSMLYRQKTNGTYHGGPMYYIKSGFNTKTG